MRVQAGATIFVSDHTNLMAAWKEFGGLDTLVLISKFVVEKPLTETQYRQLPKALKARIEFVDDGEVDWLDNLWNLPDTRG